MLAHFAAHDRIAFTAENTVNAVRGIHRSLTNCIGPLPEGYIRDRYGLLACFKRPCAAYAKSMALVVQQRDSSKVHLDKASRCVRSP